MRDGSLTAVAAGRAPIGTVFAGTPMSLYSGRGYSCGLRDLLEMRPDCGRGDVGGVDKHDRVSDMELL